MTTIIYLIGKPGTGKYTIAKELAKHDYIICDNQLINNPIFALLKYDGFKDIPEFAWEIIRKIRNNIFEFIFHERRNNYVLTNVLGEIERDHILFEQVKSIAVWRNSLFVPVKLLISFEENKRRIETPERALRYKSLRIEQDLPLINISHPHLLELDVSTLSASKAAEKILEHVKKLKIILV